MDEAILRAVGHPGHACHDRDDTGVSLAGEGLQRTVSVRTAASAAQAPPVDPQECVAGDRVQAFVVSGAGPGRAGVR